MIPELVDIINLQNCVLFSVAEDLEHVTIKAGYPESIGCHGIGRRLPARSEPAFELLLNPREVLEETPNGVVTQSYVLVVDPRKSELVSESGKNFSAFHNINSILYVPLNVGEEITHFMTFDAMD